MTRTKEEIWKWKEEDAGRGMDEGRGGTWPGRRKRFGSGRKRTREEEWMKEEGGRCQDE